MNKSQSNNPVIKGLTHVLADSYSLYLKTQNFHWNIDGPNFFALHGFFEEMYQDLATNIDEIAERIRTLGEKVTANFSAFQKDSHVHEGLETFNADKMVKTLYDDQQVIIKTLNSALQAAQKAEDEGTADLLIGRIKTHQKFSWMLGSYLGK